MTYFVMALALVLGFSQCKKEQVNTPGNETKTVNITLKVGGNGGSRHDINTTTGAVDFQDGDVIYVGDGSTYIGTLTRTDGVFSGPINEPANGTEIYFFFVGGLTPSATPEAGTTSSFTVDISNQRTKMPVLSCNHVTYYSSITSYSCTLQNQCALVKFTTASTTDPVHVGGLYTKAQIDFAAPSITHTATTGFVKLYPDADDNTAKWAVLLPQDDFSNIEGVVADKGYTISMQPETTISADGFITGEQAIGISSTPSHNRYLQWAVRDLTLEGGDHVYGTLSGNYKISIADGATVTLDNVTINGEMDIAYSWAGISCLGDATIILKDGTTNTVKGFFHNYPGIHIATGHTLTIQGTGSLDASSNGNGSGIGGGNGISCGHILIESGTITATGGGDAAGIGCGSGNDFLPTSCGNITISGGTVTAAANNHGDSGYGAGIGSGRQSSCGNITITDGASVTATKGNHALDCIGRGEDGTCGTITIGDVVYYQNNAYVGDGATYLTQNTLVYPTPAPVEQIVDLSTITSAYTAVDGDILTGTLGTGVQISIADSATITLRSANINGSDNLSGTFHGLKCLGDATIILENNDNVVKAKCGEDDGRAGIFVPRYKTLTIQGSGKIEANGAGEASGIGGYSGTHCGAIVINSGKVTATAGSNEYSYGYGAGIGACGLSRCDGVTINGGQTIATGYGYAAGIGTGGSDMATGYCNPGDQAAITISLSSGWVRAIKGNDATYFIGGGGSSHCGYVTIGGTTYEDGGGNRGISSSTSLSYDFTVSGNSLIYMP